MNKKEVSISELKQTIAIAETKINDILNNISNTCKCNIMLELHKDEYAMVGNLAPQYKIKIRVEL